MVEPLFPKSTIAEMRRMSEANLDFLASAWSYVSTDAGSRSMTRAEHQEFVDKPCRLAPNNRLPFQSIDAGAPVTTNRWLITFAAGTEVGTGWKIVVSGSVYGTPFSKKYRVIGQEGPRSNEIQRTVIAEEILGA